MSRGLKRKASALQEPTRHHRELNELPLQALHTYFLKEFRHTYHEHSYPSEDNMFNPWYRLDEFINVTDGLMLRRAVAVFLADPYRWKLWTNPDLQSEVIWVQCRKTEINAPQSWQRQLKLSLITTTPTTTISAFSFN